ncbi:hypothetical protein BST61_g5051 [Cercospora zeina]
MAMRTSSPISGTQMTGAVKQRDDQRCNMLIESRLENYLKCDYAMDEYDAIVKDLAEKSVKFRISTNPDAAIKRSNRLLNKLSTEADDDDELQQVDDRDLVNGFDESAEDAMTALG